MIGLGILIFQFSNAFADVVSFTADFSQQAQLNQPLLDCVGSGHGSLALRADYRDHLAKVQRDIGFKHIRGHGLLDDDMSSYLNGKANLINLFSIFDYYLSVGIRPIFELSFMPEALADDPQKTIMHYKGITSTFSANKAREWGLFIEDIFSGLVARYGIEEVRSWRVEVWNEPQGCGFFCPRPGQTGLEAYFELYNITAWAIAGVDPLISVGGPGTADLAWVSEFINITGAGAQMPAHFLSTHHYPTDIRNPYRTQWEDDIIKASMEAAAANLPLVVTEISAGLGSQYDPPFAGSFILHAAAAFLGVPNVPTLSYWTFTDVFEEPGFQSSTWINTYGIQTKYGVPKPSYRAFEMLSSLPTVGIFVNADTGGFPRRTDVSLSPAANCTATIGTVDVITAVDTSLGTTIALHALVTNYNCNVNDATNPATGCPIANATGVTLRFINLPKGVLVPDSATMKLIDSKHAWAKNAFVAAGSPLYPTAAQIEAEMEASQLIPQALPVAYNGGILSITLPDLEPYASLQVVINLEVGM